MVFELNILQSLKNMMSFRKWIFVNVLLSFLFNNSLQAQQNTNQGDFQGPVIKFKENIFDFGTIEEGTTARHDFKFYNIGDKPLVLKSVRPGCGCTVSEWPRDPIMPGDSGIITARFNSRGYAGRGFYKSIAVTTNMNKNNVKVIYIKGFVRKPLSFKKEPEVISPVIIRKEK